MFRAPPLIHRPLLGLALLICLVPRASVAGEARVAVAANFVPTLTVLAAAFEAHSGEHVIVISGSTGKLYAQIVMGAPFDVFLAADRARPKELERRDLIVSGSRATYALGRLALWYPTPPDTPPGPSWLDGALPIAIANPNLAPYGRAAQEVLAAVGVDPPRVFGENVGQAFAMVASGNVPRGLVALSQLIARQVPEDRYWQVPPELHAPIAQDAVLLARAADNPAARRFMAFLESDHSRRILADHGYRVP